MENLCVYVVFKHQYLIDLKSERCQSADLFLVQSEITSFRPIAYFIPIRPNVPCIL